MTYTVPTRGPSAVHPYTPPATLHAHPRIRREQTYTQTYTACTYPGPTRAGGSLYKTPAGVPPQLVAQNQPPKRSPA